MQNLQQLFPFLSCIIAGNKTIYGIIINYDSIVTSIYNIDLLTENDLKVFIQLGETWWWESNRKLPINIFLTEMKYFSGCLQSFNSKDVEHVFGPTVSLNKITTKRFKRKSIQISKRH